MTLPPVPQFSDADKPTNLTPTKFDSNQDIPKKELENHGQNGAVTTAIPLYDLPPLEEPDEYYEDIIPPTSSKLQEVEVYEEPPPLPPPLQEDPTYEEPGCSTGPLPTAVCSPNNRPLPPPPNQSSTLSPPLSNESKNLPQHPLPVFESASNVLTEVHPRPRPRSRTQTRTAHQFTSIQPQVQPSSLPLLPRAGSSSPVPQPTYLENANDADSIDSDDPYLPFKMDLESFDISKLTLEQLGQIDPRQAQLWMLLKMHQMVRKMEDVYESAEQLYGTNQAPPPPLPKKTVGKQENRPRKLNYENTLAGKKPPVPTPRKYATKSQSSQEDEDIAKESESPEKNDSPPKVIKLYRKQKVIGKYLKKDQ